MIALLAAACGGAPAAPSPRELAFDVVAQGQLAADTGTLDGAPKLVVAADASGRARLERLIRRNLPSDDAVVLVGVFQGVQRTGGYDVRVARVRRTGAAVDVSAAFTRPAPGAIVTQVITSPFVVIGIRRADLPSGRVRFVLRDESGAELAHDEF